MLVLLYSIASKISVIHSIISHEMMGSVFVFVLIAAYSYRILGVGSFEHTFDDYVYPGRTTSSTKGNGFPPEGTTRYTFDHVVYSEKTQTYKHGKTLISEPVKDARSEKKTREYLIIIIV